MVWRRRLLIPVVCALCIAGSPIAAAADDHRPPSFVHGAVTGDKRESVELAVEQILGGGPTGSPTPDGSHLESSDPVTDSVSNARPTAPPNDVCSPINVTQCAFTGAEPTPPPAGEPAVTLRDIASFRPATPVNEMEPAGWAVVGLPANFITEASVQPRSGTLLGRPAEVRFHPVAYRWTHSDGAVVQASTPGATWEELGQAEFTATATSHAYATSGEYSVELAVVYVAEYRFDGSVWRWIDGTLTIPGTPQQVLVGEFDTVLVTGDCTVAPDGPGC